MVSHWLSMCLSTCLMSVRPLTQMGMWLQIMDRFNVFDWIYSISRLKFDLMWLKTDLMWLFSNPINMLYTDGSHITVHSLEHPSIRIFVSRHKLE